MASQWPLKWVAFRNRLKEKQQLIDENAHQSTDSLVSYSLTLKTWTHSDTHTLTHMLNITNTTVTENWPSIICSLSDFFCVVAVRHPFTVHNFVARNGQRATFAELRHVCVRAFVLARPPTELFSYAFQYLCQTHKLNELEICISYF